jgi:hypothetical protein
VLAGNTWGLVSSMVRMAEILKVRAYPSLRLTARIFPGESHGSVIPLVIAWGLRAVWEKDLPTSPPSGSLGLAPHGPRHRSEQRGRRSSGTDDPNERLRPLPGDRGDVGEHAAGVPGREGSHQRPGAVDLDSVLAGGLGPQPRCRLRTISGVQRSAKISAPRAMGQYWPYVLMMPVLRARGGVSSPDS